MGSNVPPLLLPGTWCPTLWMGHNVLHQPPRVGGHTGALWCGCHGWSHRKSGHKDGSWGNCPALHSQLCSFMQMFKLLHPSSTVCLLISTITIGQQFATCAVPLLGISFIITIHISAEAFESKSQACGRFTPQYFPGCLVGRRTSLWVIPVLLSLSGGFALCNDMIGLLDLVNLKIRQPFKCGVPINNT